MKRLAGHLIALIAVAMLIIAGAIEAVIVAAVEGWVRFRGEYLETYQKYRGYTVVASVLLALLGGWLIVRSFRQPALLAKPEVVSEQTRAKGKAPAKGKVSGKAQAKIPAVPMPRLPLSPTAPGRLKGVLVILDPGHGGNTRWGTPDPGCEWKFKGEDFREAAYTFRMAKELGDLIRRQGGSVAYTAWSPAMEVVTGPRDPMPLPVRTLLADGRKLPNESEGLVDRAEVSNWFFRSNGTSYRLVTFISLHIDSMGKDWSGLHVCYDRHTKSVPRLAELIAQAIEDGRYTRQHRGVKKEALDARGILVINGGYNNLRQRVLVELGIPGDKDDSWRLRNPASRQKMLEKVIVRPLIQLAESRP